MSTRKYLVLTMAIILMLPAIARGVQAPYLCGYGWSPNVYVNQTTYISVQAGAYGGASITQITIQWGDGSVSNYVPSYLGTSASCDPTATIYQLLYPTNPASHVYTATGTYTFTITATDSNGMTTPPGSGTITVSDQPPPPPPSDWGCLCGWGHAPYKV